MYEVKGFYGRSIGAFAVGLLIVLIGLLVYDSRDVTPAAGVFLMVVGSLTLLSSVRTLIKRAPLVRATEAGVSFGGGRVIPWTAIKQVYSAGLDVRVNFVRARTSSIAFDFHKRRTMFRLPVGFWITSPLAIGDIDVSPHATADRPAVIASKLEAMRVRAVGTEDGVVVGNSELPAARVVEHDR